MLNYFKQMFYFLQNQSVKTCYVFLIFLYYLILLFFKCNYFSYFCSKDRNQCLKTFNKR